MDAATMEEAEPSAPQCRELPIFPTSPISIASWLGFTSWFQPQETVRTNVSRMLPIQRQQPHRLPRHLSRRGRTTEDPPYALQIDGEVTIPAAAITLGRYRLFPQTARDRPVWRHSEHSQLFLAFSDGAWFVQTEAAMQIDTSAGVLCLDDAECASPDCSTASWEAATDGGSWRPQAAIRCVPADAELLPPPRAFVLSRCTASSNDEASDMEELITACLGVYGLADGLQVHGRPVYRHRLNEDRILCYTGTAWTIQPMSCFGEATGWLYLPNTGGRFPDLEALPWEVCGEGGHGWQPRPDLHVREALPTELPPAPAIRLHGVVTVPTAASLLGLYTLIPSEDVNGRPVWQHTDHPQLWLAYSGTAWFVQKAASRGKDVGMLCLNDGTSASPELSRGIWSAASGGWQPQPAIACSEAEASSIPPGSEADAWPVEEQLEQHKSPVKLLSA